MDNQQNAVGNGDDDDPGDGFSGGFTGFLNTGLTNGDFSAGLNMSEFGLMDSNDILSDIGRRNTADTVQQQLANTVNGHGNPFQSNEDEDIAGSAQLQSELVATPAGIQGNMLEEGQSGWFNCAPPQKMQQFASGFQQYAHQQAFTPSGQGLFRFSNSQCSLTDGFGPPTDDYAGGNGNTNAEIPGAFSQVNAGTAWPHPNPSMPSQQGVASMAFSMSPLVNDLRSLDSRLGANGRAWGNGSFNSSLVGDTSPQNESRRQLEQNVNTHKRKQSGSFKLMRPEMIGDQPAQESQNQFMPFNQPGFANGGQQVPQTTAQPGSIGNTHLKNQQGATSNPKIDYARFFPGLSASSTGIDPTVPLRLDTSTASKIDLTDATPLEPSNDPRELNKLFSVAVGAKKTAVEKAKKRKNPDEAPTRRVRANEEVFRKLNREYNERIARSGSNPAGTLLDKVNNTASRPSEEDSKQDPSPTGAQQTGAAPISSMMDRQGHGPGVSDATLANVLKNMDPVTKKLIDCAFHLGTCSGASDAIRAYQCRLVDAAQKGMGDLTVRAFLGIPKEVIAMDENDPMRKEAVAKGASKSMEYHAHRMRHQSPDSTLCTGKIRVQDMTKLVARVPEFFAKSQGESRRTSSELEGGLTRSPSAATAVVTDRRTPSPRPGGEQGVPTTDGSSSAPRVINGDAFQGQMEMAMNGQGQAQSSLSPTMGGDASVNWTIPGQQSMRSITSGLTLAHQADDAARDTAGNGPNTTGIYAPATKAQTPRVGENGAPGSSSPFQINSGRAHVDQGALKMQAKSADVEAPKPGRGKKRAASKVSHAEEKDVSSKPKRKRTYNKKKKNADHTSTTVEKETTLSPQNDAVISNGTSGIRAASNGMSTENDLASSSSMTASDAEQAGILLPKGYDTWIKPMTSFRTALTGEQRAGMNTMLAGFGIDSNDFIDASESNASTDIDVL